MAKLRSKRDWLEKPEESGSYYNLQVDTDMDSKGYVTLTLADCHRNITWYFGVPGKERAVKKIKKVKKLVDSIYEHLVPEDQR